MRIERDFTKWLENPDQATQELEIIDKLEHQAIQDLKEEKLTLIRLNLLLK